MRLLLVLFLPLAVGCASDAINAHAEAATTSANRSAEARVVYASCPGGAAIGPSCGLILKRVAQDDFRNKFRDQKCASLDDDACQALFQSSVDQWLADRYYLADFAAVDAECRRHPGKCDDPVAHEEIMLDLHNARVRAELANDEEAIEQDRQIRQRINADHQQRAFDTAAFIMTMTR